MTRALHIGSLVAAVSFVALVLAGVLP